MFETVFAVEFGDCDPAGIVFYPNFSRWLDAAFQGWLRERGTSQSDLQARFDAIGTGLVESAVRFRRPVRAGERLRVRLEAVEWERRTFALRYAAHVETGSGDGDGDGALAVKADERRGLFAARPDGTLRLLPLEPLRALLEA